MNNELNKDFREFMKRIMYALNKQNIAIAKTAGLRDDSRLIRSFETRTNFRVVQFLANDYYDFVDRGRRPFTRKVPIERLLDWIRRYNISAQGMTSNQLAFAIQTNIYKYGIEPKLMKEAMTNSMLDILEKNMTNELEKLIAEEAASAFIK